MIYALKKYAFYLVLICICTNGLFAETMYIKGYGHGRTTYYGAQNRKTIIGEQSFGDAINIIETKDKMAKFNIEGWLKYKNVVVVSEKDNVYKAKQGVFVLGKPNSFYGLHITYFNEGTEFNKIDDKNSKWLKIKREAWIEEENLVSQPTKAIELLSWEWQSGTNNIMITGIVMNHTEITHDFMELIITAKDSNGTMLGTGKGYISKNKAFSPGDKSSFTIFIDAVSSSIKSIFIDYKWTSLQIEQAKEKK